VPARILNNYPMPILTEEEVDSIAWERWQRDKPMQQSPRGSGGSAVSRAAGGRPQW
jgi:hypothetical protein